MKLTSYLYHGPQSGVTLCVAGQEGEEQTVDVVLYPGRKVELPADHEYTRALLAQKLITLQPAAVKAVKAEAKTKEQKDDGR